MTSKKRLQGRLCKTLKRCKYGSVVACEKALCLGKEFAPRPKDCSQVTASGLLMYDSYFENLDRPHEKRQSGVFKNMYSEDRFQKTCHCNCHCSLRSWRYCVGVRLKVWGRSRVPKKRSRDEAVEIFTAASSRVTAPPSNLTRLYDNGSAAKSHE